MYLCIYIRFEQVSIVVLLYVFDEFHTGNWKFGDCRIGEASCSRIYGGSTKADPSWCHGDATRLGNPVEIPRWRLQMLRPTESLLSSSFFPEARASVQGGGDGKTLKELSKWKGHGKTGVFWVLFSFLDILITGLLPFFLSTKCYNWIIMKYYEVFEDDINSTAFNSHMNEW